MKGGRPVNSLPWGGKYSRKKREPGQRPQARSRAGVRGTERGSVLLKQSECRAEDAQPSLPPAEMICKYGPEALSFSRQNLWADKQHSTPPHPSRDC